MLQWIPSPVPELFPGQASHAEDERDAGKKNQSFRDHAKNTGYGAHQGGRKGAARVIILDAEQGNPDRKDGVTYQADNAIDCILHFGSRTALSSGFFNQLGSVVIGACLSCRGIARSRL